MAYTISQVSPGDKRAMAEIDALLEREGVRRDRNLDYICALYDEDYRIAATGSCFGLPQLPFRLTPLMQRFRIHHHSPAHCPPSS